MGAKVTIFIDKLALFSFFIAIVAAFRKICLNLPKNHLLRIIINSQER